MVFLRGDDWVRSLGAIYSQHGSPDAKFDAILEKIKERMCRWQRRKPSLMARVLLSNTILVSCIWYFVYFIVPSADQVKLFDEVVWGMTWGRESGDMGTRGQVNRARMTAVRELGGLKILLPSDMIKAIRANMVNRALQDRGRWWAHFFIFYRCEQASEGLFRGADALLVEDKPSLRSELTPKLGSTFWEAAVADWSHLDYLPVTDAAHLPRERHGAFPALYHHLSRQQRRAPSLAVQVLVRASLIYLSDMWDYTRMDWLPEEQLLDEVGALRLEMGCPEEEVLALYRSVKANPPLFSHMTEELSVFRDSAVPKDGPVVDEVWAEVNVDPMIVGVVTEVDVTRSGPRELDGADRDECVCGLEGGSQGDLVMLQRVDSQGGYGQLQLEAVQDAPHHAQLMAACSCTLSRVHVSEDRMQGAVATSWLVPSLVSATVPPRLRSRGRVPTPFSLSAPVSHLRSFYRAHRLPSSFTTRPRAELKWGAELALANNGLMDYHAAKQLDNRKQQLLVVEEAGRGAELRGLVMVSDSEWGQRWSALSSARLSGPTRSFLWKLTHRRTPNLAQQWLAQHYQRPDRCLLCAEHSSETYSHLFSDCTTAAAIWQELVPVLALPPCWSRPPCC